MEGLIFYILLFHVTLLLCYIPYRQGKFYISNSKLCFFMILFILLGTYGNHFGDYFRYSEMIEIYGKSPWYDIGISMEPQYYYLAKIVDGSPTLWRLIIYSIEFIGLGFFLKKSNMNTYPTLLFFIVSCLFWATGHRAWWGLVYFFFGTYLCFYKRNYLYLLFCLAVLYSHSSHFILFCLLPIAFLRFNKYVAIFVIIMMLSSLNVFQDYFNTILIEGMEDEYASQKIHTYSSQGGQKFFGDSIGEILQNVTSKVPIYIFYIYLFIRVIFNRNFRINMPTEVNAIVNISFCLFMAALVFNLIDTNSGIFATRILTMCSFSAILIAPKVLIGNKEKYYHKLIKWKWISIELTYIIALYYTIVNS